MAKNFEARKDLENYREYKIEELPEGVIYKMSIEGDDMEGVNPLLIDQSGDIFIDSSYVSFHGSDRLKEGESEEFIDDILATKEIIVDNEGVRTALIIDIRHHDGIRGISTLDEEDYLLDDQEKFNDWLDGVKSRVKVDALILNSDNEKGYSIYCNEEFEEVADSVARRIDQCSYLKEFDDGQDIDNDFNDEDKHKENGLNFKDKLKVSLAKKVQKLGAKALRIPYDK